jgi:hypothetical protein
MRADVATVSFQQCHEKSAKYDHDVGLPMDLPDPDFSLQDPGGRDGELVVVGHMQPACDAQKRRAVGLDVRLRWHASDMHPCIRRTLQTNKTHTATIR